MCTPPQSPLVKPVEFRLDSDSESDHGNGNRGGFHLDRPQDDTRSEALVIATSRACIAREARLAAIGAAEARVRRRALETEALVDVRRHAETHSTERTRIEEDARTRRVESFAKVAEVLVTERARTQRERDAQHAQAVREALAMWGQLEMQKAKVVSTTPHFFQLMLASLVGAVSVRASSHGPPRAARRVVGRVQLVLAILFIALARRLWSDAASRRLFTGPAELMLRRMLQSAARTVAAAALVAPPGAPSVGGPASTPPGLTGLMLGPEAEPHLWRSKVGPDGRTFWHHLSLGPVPWDEGEEFRHEASLNEDLGQVAAETPDTRSPQSGRFGALLSNWGLGAYAGLLERNGYDPESMRALSDLEVGEMLSVVGCKPEHALTFHKALDSWR